MSALDRRDGKEEERTAGAEHEVMICGDENRNLLDLMRRIKNKSNAQSTAATHGGVAGGPNTRRITPHSHAPQGFICHLLMEMVSMQAGTGWGSWWAGGSNASIEWL